LSISTVYTKNPSQRPYEDSAIGPDDLGRYKWRGLDPNQADNCALRTAMEQQLPLIWFLGYASGRYAAVYPVYLIKEEPELQQFVVAVAAMDSPVGFDINYLDSDIEMSYVTRATRQRLHQAPFRAAVLQAYRCRCAVCRFGHPPLLDAAHIVADAAGGRPTITNGLSLCKMHHGAYDSGIIGIRPDLIVEVNQDVLNEHDGPMLRHGIQEFHHQPLMVIPDKRSERPDPEALSVKYGQFLSRI
jgi:putative restriction endonuclease